jgi:hypothetical protein
MQFIRSNSRRRRSKRRGDVEKKKPKINEDILFMPTFVQNLIICFREDFS